MKNKRTPGFWIIFGGGVFLLVNLVLGQTMSFINYDFTVAIGLQESKDLVGEMGVAINKAFGVGDTLIYIPLLLSGLIGLWQRKQWGLCVLAGALTITAYWPVVWLFILFFAKGSPGFNFTNYVSYSVILSSFMIYGLWGLCYLYKNHSLLFDKS
jgi:hypothetical protein